MIKVSISGDIKGEVPDISFVGLPECSPVVGPEGHVYLIGYHPSSKCSYLYQFDLRAEDPKQWDVGKWKIKLAGKMRSSSFIVNSKGIVFVAVGTCIQAIRNDGSEKWAVPLHTNITSSPVLDEKDRLYVLGDNGYVYALNIEDGSLIWDQIKRPLLLDENRGNVRISPVVGIDSTRIFISTYDTIFGIDPYAIDSNGNHDGRQKGFKYLSGEIYGSPTLGPDGTLYVAAGKYWPEKGLSLYALSTEASGTAEASSDWPMYLKDALHTNCARLQVHVDLDWRKVHHSIITEESDLVLLRNFRDEYLLAKSDSGRNYVQRLYEQSNASLQVLLDNPELIAEAKELLAQNRQSLKKVLQGQATEIINSAQIIAFLDKLAMRSSGDFNQLVIDLKEEMLNQRRLGKTFMGMKLT